MITVAQAPPSDRALFIRRTYTHLAGAIAAFIAIEYILFTTGIAGAITNMLAGSRFVWLAILGGFALLGWFARSLIARAKSGEQEYLGLGIYIVAEAIIFAPILYIAAYVVGNDVLPIAVALTLLLFAGLTAIAFTTRRDFSFLRGFLTVGGFVALGLIVCSVIFGFTLGLIFSGAMVIFASAAILYDTSKVMHHYSTTQHVVAALELFASVALLFWYVLRIVMAMRR
ncbi:Bax inhibitor-1 family protein [Oscillatoria sp. CS-180]|uniref:Bax inhibitor-1/YccA family protein n=1 Tax=Oscillatoria sp. CS-180 TaxID=3021720 RepID=UPI00232CE590|nr:Bax inhibitor-1 family protein [Oscillatoria sp. CS-180]MDB9529502.1 Bax inhibitor-1 family protein [Oscillatoria sp. CS-180]